MTAALLLVMMEPPRALLDEFQDWYDTEHIPERVALDGFYSATRWRCIEGSPAWLAVYEIADLGVLETKAYKAISGENFSPWSRRMLSRVSGLKRIVVEHVTGTFSLTDASQNGLLIGRIHSGRAAEIETSISKGGKTFDDAGLFKDESGDLWMVGSGGPGVLIQEPGAAPVLEFANRYEPYRKTPVL